MIPKLSALEAELRTGAREAMPSAPAEAFDNFFLMPAPPHVKADISVPWAISAAKALRQPPIKIAEQLKAALAGKAAGETAPPGFLNFTLGDDFLLAALKGLADGSTPFGSPENGGDKVNIEFVSANPTGPLHLASGRGATLGDTLARIMRFLGYQASSEFYVNDMGRQVELLGRSLKARLKGEDVPEDGYKGAYLKDMAAVLPAEAANWPDEKFSRWAIEAMLKLHEADMAAFRVKFERWFLESELHSEDGPKKALAELKAKGMAFEKEGATWFGLPEKSESDDKDRVLVKSDGRNTYFLNDIAYHLNKYDRGFTRLIDIWGADHHGYVPRMEAAVAALGRGKGTFKVIIHQQVLLKRGEEVVKMSKREGDFVSLKELVEEVGADACRFFFATRSPNSHLTFDIDLAKKKSNDNPVFYVQYVHARICSIFANAEGLGLKAAAPAAFAPNAGERALILKLLWLERTLETCVKDSSPHHLTTYLMELAALFHSFYDQNKVLDAANPEVSSFRLHLLSAVKRVIAEGLGLLGVTSPEKM